MLSIEQANKLKQLIVKLQETHRDFVASPQSTTAYKAWIKAAIDVDTFINSVTEKG